MLEWGPIESRLILPPGSRLVEGQAPHGPSKCPDKAGCSQGTFKPTRATLATKIVVSPQENDAASLIMGTDLRRCVNGIDCVEDRSV